MVNSAPDCALQVTETIPELSEIAGSFHIITAVGFSLSVKTDWSSMQSMFGASLSVINKNIVEAFLNSYIFLVTIIDTRMISLLNDTATLS